MLVRVRTWAWTVSFIRRPAEATWRTPVVSFILNSHCAVMMMRLTSSGSERMPMSAARVRSGCEQS